MSMCQTLVQYSLRMAACISAKRMVGGKASIVPVAHQGTRGSGGRTKAGTATGTATGIATGTCTGTGTA
ncbi:hypothetical protein RC55_17955 [Herbaspirillum seropedicae]|nr:hypothetical protein ACP92_04170 [Herbaspirillum seropedicae]NQE31113.1 hypothetical protein [Herbaspirillum seropedicae]